MKNICKNQELLLVTELILCNSLKANGKILLGFCQRNQFGLQKYVITIALNKKAKIHSVS